MDNFSRAIETTSLAYDSAGSAMEEHLKWQDSLEGKVNDLKSAWEQLSTTTMSSDLVKNVVELSTGVLELINSIGGLTPVVLGLVGALMMFKATAITTFLKSAFTSIAGSLVIFANKIGLVVTGTQTLSGALYLLAPALTTVGGALGAITIALGAGMIAYNQYKKSVEENKVANEKMVTAARDQVYAVGEQVKSYKELYESKEDDVKKTKELLELQGNMEDTLGIEKEKLDLVNGSYERNIELLKEQLEIRARIINGENEANLESAIKDVDDFAGKGIKINPVDKKMIQENVRKLSREVNDAFVIEGSILKIRPKLELDPREVKTKVEKLYAELFQLEDFAGSSLNKNLKKYVVSFRENFDTLDKEIEKTASDMVDSVLSIFGVTDPLEVTSEQYADINEQLDKMLVGYEGVATKTEVSRLAGEKLVEIFTQFTEFQPEIEETEHKMETFGKTVFDISGKFQEATEKTFSLKNAMNELLRYNDLSDESVKKLAKSYPELLDSMDNYSALSNKIQSMLIAEETEKQTKEIKLLNEAINSLNDGQTLTGKTLTELVTVYPDLREQVEKVNGVYTISIEALEGVREETVLAAKTMLEAEAKKTSTQLENARWRIESMKEELVALQTLTQAYAIAAASATRKMVFNRNPFDTQGKMNAAGEWNTATQEGLKINEEIALYEKAIAQGEERAAAIQEKADAINASIQNLSIAGSASNTKKGDNISNKGGKDPKKEVDKQFDEAIKRIKERSKDLEREIELVKNKIALAQSKGDTNEETRLEKEMVKLLERKKIMQNSQADELRGLKTKYKEKEKQSKLDEEIANLSNGWWSTRKEQLEQEVDLIQQKYDLEKTAFEERMKKVELEQILLESNSKEYIAREREKYNLIHEIQEQTVEQIKELREKGLSDTSSEVKSLLDLWHGYETDKLNIIKSLAEQRKKVEIDRVKLELDELKKKEKAFKDLHEKVIDMIKDETNQKIDALEKEKKAYKKVIDMKKKALKDEKKDRDYNKGLEERKKKIADLEKELLSAQLDTSEAGKAKRLKLEEELKKAREEMEDYQYDRTMEKTEEALDKEYEDYVETKDKEIEKLKDYLAQEGTIRADALKKIESQNKSFYNKLMEWNKTYGTGVATDITNAWELGMGALDKYGQSQDGVLGVMREMTLEMEKLTTLQKNLSDGKYDNDFSNQVSNEVDHKKVVQKMKENAQKWHQTEDKDEQNKLANENNDLGTSIGAFRENGVWYIYKNGKKVKLFDTYHTGAKAGFVGGEQPALKSNEVFAKLLKKELVLTPNQMDNFMRDTLPSLMGHGGGGVTIDKFIELVVEGNLDSSVDIENIIDKASTQAIDKLKKALFNKGKFRGANLSAL